MSGFPNRHLQYRLKRIENKLDLILESLGIAEPGLEMDVVLVNHQGNLLSVVKAVKAIRNCTLGEAKSIVDRVPTAVVSQVNDGDAELVYRELIGAGAAVELLPSGGA